MANVGALTASLALESAAFRQDMRQAAAAVTSNTAQMNRAMGRLQKDFAGAQRAAAQLRTGIAALGGALAIRQFGQFAAQALEAADAIAKTADAVGLSTRALQTNRAAFGLAGVSAEKFDKAMERFVRNLGDARQGTGSLATALKDTAPAFLQQLSGIRDTERAFDLYLGRLAATEDAQDRARLAAAAFGREGVRMTVGVKDGTAALEAQRQKAVALGLVLEDDLLRQAEAVNDRMSLLKQAFDVGFQRAIIEGFAASFELTAENITAAREAGENFGRLVGKSMMAVAAAAEFVAANFEAIGAAVAALAALKMAAMVSAVVPPMILLAKATKAVVTGQALMTATSARGAKALLGLAVAAAAAVAAYEGLSAPINEAIAAAEEMAAGLGVLGDAGAGFSDAAKAAADLTKSLDAENEALQQLKYSYVDFGKTMAEAEFDRELHLATQARGIALASEEGQKILELLERRRQLNREIEEETARRERAAEAITALNEKMAEEARKAEDAWRHTTDRIVDFWADTWTSVLDGSLQDAGEFAENLKSLLLRTFAQISANAVIRPILDASGLTGAGGTLSGAGTLVGTGLGALGSANQSPLTSALGGISALLSGGSTFGSTALQYGVANFPETLASLGLAQEAIISGPGLATTGFIPTGLGTNLAAGINASPYGAFGTLGAQLLGFESRNPMVGAGLGVAGSIAGGTLGGMALGTAVGGPVGAVVGAFLAQVASSYLGPNASVGPNASASLGFSAGRFGVGASGNDNGGDASPFVQGVQQVADALNGIMAAAGLSVANPGQSFWSFGLGTQGTSPFGQDPQALLQSVLTSGALVAEDDNVQTVLGRLSGDLNEMLAQLDFAATFEKSLDAMSAGALDFAAVLKNQVAAEVEGQVEALKAFAEQTAALGLDTHRAEVATRDYVRTLLGLRPEPAALTAVEQAMLRVNTTFAELSPLLDQVGISAAEAQGGLQKLTAEIAADFTRSLEADINEATGLGAVNAISALIAAAEENRRSAIAAGADTSLVDTWLQARIQAELARADEAGILGVLAQLTASPVAIRLATDALAALNAEAEETEEVVAAVAADLGALDRRLQDQVVDTLRDMASEAEAAAERFDGFARSLAGFRQDLLVGSLSPLSAADQLAAARERLAGLQGGIAAGDPLAFEDLQGVVRQFLEASQAFNASGPGFAADFGWAQEILQQAEAAAAAQAARQRELAEAGLRQVEELRGIRSVLEEMTGPLIEFATLGARVLAGQAGGASAIDAQHALLQQMGPDELAVALGAMAPGGQGQAEARRLLGSQSFSDEIQQALKDQFANLGAQVQAGQVTGAEAMRQQLAILSRADMETLAFFASLMNPKGQNSGAVQDFLRQFNGLATTNPVPGFAAGGVTPGGAAMLHAGEILYTGPPGRVWSQPELAGLEIGQALHGSGRGGVANDDEVAALRRDVRQMTRTNAQGLQGVIDGLARVEREVAGGRRDQTAARLDRPRAMRWAG
ncbi:MAG: hypothetical protein RIB84_08525 [Sneathiellaceae bacterium]